MYSKPTPAFVEGVQRFDLRTSAIFCRAIPFTIPQWVSRFSCCSHWVNHRLCLYGLGPKSHSQKLKRGESGIASPVLFDYEMKISLEGCAGLTECCWIWFCLIKAILLQKHRKEHVDLDKTSKK